MTAFNIIILLLILLFILLWVFFPEKGIYYRLKKYQNDKERIAIEDALKYIFDCEYKGAPCKIEGISQYLGFNRQNTVELVDRLKKMKLLDADSDEIALAPKGKKYALKIIRIHRIWERYLAEETGAEETDWHIKADKIEHFLSSRKANEIASKIGNPVYDPHGDPIPTEEGIIPPYQGKSLMDYDQGDNLIVTHLEDEPTNVYSQLVVAGFFPGMEIIVLKKYPEKIMIAVNDEKIVLQKDVANSVTVIYAKEKSKQEKSIRLSELNIGEKALVIGISPASRGLERRRFMDLGIIPGAEIKALLQSPGGDPIAYEILDTKIAFRKNQTEKILVKRV